MNRRYIDPHLDPLRAPSRAGHHPHLVEEHSSKRNPQHMYEQRDQLGHYGQAPSAPQPQQNTGGGLLDNPVILLGLGALAAYVLLRAARGDDEGKSRRNPAPVECPPTAPFVVISPSVSLPTEPKALLPAPAASAAPAAVPSTAAPVKKRTRRTTQARTKEGKFKRAGTRRRAVIEGEGSE